ncbi:hypothetical protein ACYATM_05950 [Lactobacillaceae bacterium Scapto_B20]
MYIGTYHDQDNNLRLDINSIDKIPHHTVNKLYNDMMKLGIVDGANQNQFVEYQIDELNQSNCDLLNLTSKDLKTLIMLLDKKNL